MKTYIIIENINTILHNELRDFMQNAIHESMNALDSHDANILWYEDCTMDEYFAEWTEIWDEDENERIGDGIDTIAHKFVLNDDTRPDFENAFEQARDTAFEEYMKKLGDEIVNAEGTLEDIEHEEEDWNGELEGYERIGTDEEFQTDFHDHGLYNTILRIVGAPPMTVTQYAIWMGATAVWQSKEEWCDIYYKRKEQPKGIIY